MLPPRGSFGARLLLTQLLIVLVGGTTLLLVALSLAPGLFRTHVARTVGPVSSELAQHLDMAFARAVLFALAVAMTTATIAALAIGLFVARRAMRPIDELSRAASALAAGDYAARVNEDGFGSEIATLARAFNQMAADLAATERTRAEMLRDLAHELRTPLTSVRGYHEAVADGVLPADRTTFARVDAELARIERLVEDLDLVSRAEERRLDLRLRPMPVDQLVAAAADAASPVAGAAGVLVLTGGGAGVGAGGGAVSQVLVDPDRLHEALSNLLSNAIRRQRDRAGDHPEPRRGPGWTGPAREPRPRTGRAGSDHPARVDLRRDQRGPVAPAAVTLRIQVPPRCGGRHLSLPCRKGGSDD